MVPWFYYNLYYNAHVSSIVGDFQACFFVAEHADLWRIYLSFMYFCGGSINIIHVFK